MMSGLREREAACTDDLCVIEKPPCLGMAIRQGIDNRYSVLA